MKRTLLAVVPMACMTVSPTLSHAQESGSHFDGVYVGAEGGILNSFANIDSTTRAN